MVSAVAAAVVTVAADVPEAAICAVVRTETAVTCAAGGTATMTVPAWERAVAR